MEKIKLFLKSYMFYLIGGVFLVLILIFQVYMYYFFNNKFINIMEDKNIEVDQLLINKEIQDENVEVIDDENIVEKYYVDIKGKVKTPGVYALEDGSRVIDVINKAGGLLNDADTSYINLSKRVFDQMVIIIYGKNDIIKFDEVILEKEDILNEIVEKDNIKNDAIIDKNIIEDKQEENNIIIGEEKIDQEIDDNNKKLININTALIDELMILPSIGEAKAKKIIEYREKSGDFEKIEDIMNVSGIGEALFEKIKEYITV